MQGVRAVTGLLSNIVWFSWVSMQPKVEDVEFSGYAVYYWVTKGPWEDLRQTLFDLD